MFLTRSFEGIIIGFILFLTWYPFYFKRNTLFRNLCIASLFIYVGAVVCLTMIYTPPWNWNISQSATRFALSSVNLMPFERSITIFGNCKRMGYYRDFIWLIGGNTVMLMPLGILVSLVNDKFCLGKVTLLAMAVSLSIELLQLGSNILLGTVLRTVEIDDFIQNTLGCIVAYLIFALLRGIYRHIKGDNL